MVLAFCGLEQTCIAQICFSFMWFSQITRVVFFPLIECGRAEDQHLFFIWVFYSDLGQSRGKEDMTGTF